MPETCRKREKNRIAYYQEAASAEFWDAHWAERIDTANYAPYLAGYLGVYERPFRKYMPKDGRILEAGCGMGRNVVGMRANGYDCEGVDFGARTIRKILKKFPELPVRVGDVTQLDVPEDYYSGYISLGVVEHLESGPEPFLKEAKRVLRPGGIAYISVPYVNLIRYVKMKLGLYKDEAIIGQEFYQYAFCAGEMISILKDAGFDPISTHGYGSWKGIGDEVPLIRWIDEIPKVSGAYRILTRTIPYCDRVFGHMLGFVCRT